MLYIVCSRSSRAMLQNIFRHDNFTYHRCAIPDILVVIYGTTVVRFCSPNKSPTYPKTRACRHLGHLGAWLVTSFVAPIKIPATIEFRNSSALSAAQTSMNLVRVYRMCTSGSTHDDGLPAGKCAASAKIQQQQAGQRNSSIRLRRILQS